ncbi:MULTISPECIES: hypothetical protein [unclassified Modicisalibacter]|nr:MULTISPECIES: hypothetical protein [unclassified Modicisalibacter]MBZ9559860.1 hypothetical protein [Modicisalibacter sp. R2A 31.J]MBZ9577312.1 hypothetical protein [Modicisalibacter sp. MOD 31.J]
MAPHPPQRLTTGKAAAIGKPRVASPIPDPSTVTEMAIDGLGFKLLGLGS